MSENPDIGVEGGSPKPEKSFWTFAFSWPVLGVVSAILITFGTGLMLSPHPFITDGFFIAGILIIGIKFWTWEGSKHDTSRKTGLLLAGGTIFLLGITFGLCWLIFYLNKPSVEMTYQPTTGDKQPIVTPKTTLSGSTANPVPDPSAKNAHRTTVSSAPKTAITLSPPTIQVNADNNQGNVAGVNNGQMVVNQVGVGTPKILWKPAELDTTQDGSPQPIHPRATVSIKTDRLWPKAKFAVFCDMPCTPAKWYMLGISHPNLFTLAGSPDVAIFYFDMPNPFPADTIVKLTVESMDDKQVKVINVGSFEDKLPGED